MSSQWWTRHKIFRIRYTSPAFALIAPILSWKNQNIVTILSTLLSNLTICWIYCDNIVHHIVTFDNIVTYIITNWSALWREYPTILSQYLQISPHCTTIHLSHNDIVHDDYLVNNIGTTLFTILLKWSILLTVLLTVLPYCDQFW